MAVKVIDLFAGCGGLSSGFRKAGYSIESAVEFDPAIANTYKHNFPSVNVIVDDIKNVDSSGVLKTGDADVIIGGPPCQGFSMAGARIRQGFIDDPRNYLFKHYFNVVREVKPVAFVMENVKGMKSMQGGKVFKEIMATFSDPDMNDGIPYHIHHRIINAVNFGIPQKRERLLIIGTTTEIDADKFDTLWLKTKAQIRAEYPNYFTPVTVRDAIGNLPPAARDGIVDNPVPVTEYQKYLASSAKKIMNHRKSNHSRKVIERMKQISSGQNYTELDEKIKSVHSGSYGRLYWDRPATTITTRFDTPAGGRFTHPFENRTLTPRETARIQSFSDDFIFYGARREISRQIGNAVPPKVAYFVAKLIETLINSTE